MSTKSGSEHSALLNGTTTSHPRIAIIGAGLGDLMLLRTLQLRNVPATIFEADPSASARAELGGTLDMHAGSGLTAFQRVGLMDEFKKIARFEGEAMRAFDKHGKIHIDEKPPTAEEFNPDNPSTRPEADRSDLRRILLESVSEGSIQWGSKLVKVDSPSDKTQPIALHFADGRTVNTELLVGADGAFSKVRPLLSDAKPFYSGYVYLELLTRDVDSKHPKLAELVGPGSMFAIGDGKCLVSQRNGGSRVRTYAGLKVPEQWPEEPKTVEEVAKLYEDWAPELVAAITSADSGPTKRQLWQLPSGHTWTHNPRITLLGDAAHLSLPTGDGANWALIDGYELGEAIAQGSSLWATATGFLLGSHGPIAAYEKKACARAASTAYESKFVMKALFGEDVELFCDMLSSFGPPPLDPRKWPLWTYMNARIFYETRLT